MSLVAYSDSEEENSDEEPAFVVQRGDGDSLVVSSEDETPLDKWNAAKPKFVDEEIEPGSAVATGRSTRASSSINAPPPLVNESLDEDADAAAAADNAFPVINWTLTVKAAKKMSVPALRLALEHRQLETSGLKPVLLDRLIQAIESGLGSPSEERRTAEVAESELVPEPELAPKVATEPALAPNSAPGSESEPALEPKPEPAPEPEPALEPERATSEPARAAESTGEQLESAGIVKQEAVPAPTLEQAPAPASIWCRNHLCPPEHEEMLLQKMERAAWETAGTQGLSPLKWEGAEDHEGCYVVMGNSLSRKDGATLDRPIERNSIVTIDGKHRARVGAIMMVQIASADAYHHFLDAVGALPLGEWLLLLGNPTSGIFMASPDNVTKVETASDDDRRVFASDGQMTQLIRTMCRFDGARDGRVNVAVLQPYASAMAALNTAAKAAKAAERKGKAEAKAEEKVQNTEATAAAAAEQALKKAEREERQRAAKEGKEAQEAKDRVAREEQEARERSTREAKKCAAQERAAQERAAQEEQER